MKISYNKLWKLLIDCEMKRKDLKEVTGLSSSSMAKLGKNDPVSLDILMRICEVLNCQIGDIMEFIKHEVKD
jgi:DNA-binding Xre family transcriptional regulator